MILDNACPSARARSPHSITLTRPTKTPTSYPKDSYALATSTQSRIQITFVELDVDEEFYLAQRNANIVSGQVTLSTTIREDLRTTVRTHRDRYKSDFEMLEHEKQDIATITWRCPSSGPYPETNNMPPLPPMNKVMADSLKLGPLGARWGRTAHWPLI